MVLTYEPGKEVPAGQYICADCGHVITLQTDARAVLPKCPDRARHPHDRRAWRAVYARSVADPAVMHTEHDWGWSSV